MRFQLSETPAGGEFAIVCQSRADVGALMHFFNQSLYQREPELATEIMFELNDALRFYTQAGTQPSLFDPPEAVTATAQVGVENKIPAPRSSTPSGWASDNAEFEAGRQWGFSGGVLPDGKGERFVAGYNAGAAFRIGDYR